ncbi:DUF6415 family natural product biosynthesis protein [Streptomyces sp. NBC_01214]|uniref:DUF6415 family natural product biosynthesis protein n=1 Tax=Streptomyces sp. NBC_01214 TaxID=2903777 RepID=UPI00224F435B|nr:DUF6415 family natural product biosynthesis protein [Streptomyces sp. NBC_01214]MCX4804665.1 DUF6415 family natural product biosynthesis protein [Streptomyces sp. NBC_01214]
MRLDVGDTREAVLLQVLEGLRRSFPPPVVPDSTFDVLNAVLGPDHVPDEDEVPLLIMRMRGSLMELLPRVPLHDARKPDFAALIAKAHLLLDTEPPATTSASECT